MNIGFIGYGKMGQSIERQARLRGHKKLFITNKTPTYKELKNSKIEMIIEFSSPKFAVSNIIICIENKIPIVSGTTGWDSDFCFIKNTCKKYNGSFIYSPNFSIGVNILFYLNQKIAKIMSKSNLDYKVSIKEIHHKNKLDTPSGTAIALAKDIILENYCDNWGLVSLKEKKRYISIYSKRIKNIIGIHSVLYESDIDSIEIKHIANNRTGFVLGSVIAAEWLYKKYGFFSMKDVIKL
ncbi:4-hydroxy-tetrahydrodipicolinate reductase [Candidatus Karelsulcia muelleri]|uniref:4-hydroxy-tetrahydrodipicolinate reductase n=1 Tax=Candidatus Karelsulcia muelleri TaxID=336810 RepID=UPI00163BB91B|nr:4-hydroxy-tetrahydrodipicolinate reductase [Candidatus Karelsulcia muelleri]QND78394.1 4-hydroxy-tetrahydrodipicolinate reductase [Candidatus Karelsulcia muelleri]